MSRTATSPRMHLERAIPKVRRTWQPAEVAWLRANIHRTNAELAAHFGVPVSTITPALYRYGIRRPLLADEGRPRTTANPYADWSKQDDAAFRAAFPTTTNRELALRFNRSERQIEGKAHRMQIKKDPSHRPPRLRQRLQHPRPAPAVAVKPTPAPKPAPPPVPLKKATGATPHKRQPGAQQAAWRAEKVQFPVWRVDPRTGIGYDAMIPLSLALADAENGFEKYPTLREKVAKYRTPAPVTQS